MAAGCSGTVKQIRMRTYEGARDGGLTQRE
eukprot:COSAG06_NODE_54100_length_296_cov_1.020305_1_plen_29_part_10